MPDEARGTIFGEPALVVNQKSKFIEVDNEYTIHDREGRQLAAVRQVGQGMAKKVLRFLGTPVDKHLAFKLQVLDMDGGLLLELTRPPKLVKSRVVVHDAHGEEVGQIVQKRTLGKVSFSLESGGEELGRIIAQDWSSWEFTIEGGSGAEIARISKSLRGVSLLDLFSTSNDFLSSADTYAVEIQGPIDQPLRSLVIAAALAVDVALHQD